MTALKWVNLALRFFIELAAIAAFCFWGFHMSGSVFLKVGFGLGVPILASVFWGFFMAPNSSRRASGIRYIMLEIIIFGLATAALIAADQTTIALIFAGIAALNAVYLHLTGPEPSLQRGGN